MACEAGHFSELYALSSFYRWEWENLASIIVHDFISSFVNFAVSQPPYSSISLLTLNFCPQLLFELLLFQLSGTLATLLNHTLITPQPISYSLCMCTSFLSWHISNLLLIHLWVEQLPWYFSKSLLIELIELHAEKIHQCCHLTCNNIIWVFKSDCGPL